MKRLAGCLRRSSDTATAEDLRRFQLYLVGHGTSPITLNTTITGLQFFFDAPTHGSTDALERFDAWRAPEER